MTTRRRGWSRRDLLRAAGLSSVGAALLPFLPRSVADAAPPPKRLVLLTHGQGTDMTTWRPQGSGTSFSFAPDSPLEPLTPFKDRMIVLDGIDNVAAIEGAGTGHFGQGTMWTGVETPTGTVRPENLGWPKAASIDHLIGAHLAGQTRFPAFYLGTWPIATDGPNQGPNGIAHYRGSENPINPQLDPADAFDTLFEGVMGTDPAIGERLRRERKSVIDLVNGELGRLRTEMPDVDRTRFDEHIDSLRQLEERLSVVALECQVPTRPGDYGNVQDFANVGVHTRLHFELMRHALVCDLTRVLCFDWPHSEGYGDYMDAEGYRTFGSIHTVAHTMSYDEVDGQTPSDDARRIAREDTRNLNHWRSRMIADELLGKLPAEVADSMLLVWASEMSEGGTHSNRNVPIVMVQGPSFGAFSTGRYLKWGDYDPISNPYNSEGKPMNQVLVSICQAMGMDVDVVGDAQYGSGPLTELVG